ncbi:hypothetical protein [Puniceicoccus vermicola]|uniref:HEAT repeat domain-containing protein n=1 Tax=Puniceicoccus vermicola TaxID=388746 RepID=A0A7X1B1Y3_9BACT|nr:hypothetical protein [Puniceicoccus vermicola]MBC2603043.1 hypothetical protein [Puniceicoccus vermicola]
MTRIIAFFLAQLLVANALTEEEFTRLEPSEKIEILRGRPDRLIDDTKALLSLYSSALYDESSDVRLAAAQASVLLMVGVQSAPVSAIPAFHPEDTVVFQHRLASLINDENPAVRMAASQALAYSSSPNKEIEDLLMNAVEAEAVDEVKISTLTAMSAAGYESFEISDLALEIFKSTQDSLVQHQSWELLGFLQDDRLLSKLIIIAKGNNSSLSKGALLAIAGYGENADEIKPHLLEIINSSDLDTEIINLAEATYDFIAMGKKPGPSMQAISTRSLWPVDLPDQSDRSIVSEGHTEIAEVIEEGTAAEPNGEESSEVVVAEPIEEPVEQSSDWWLWLIVAVVGVGGVLVLRLKK